MSHLQMQSSEQEFAKPADAPIDTVETAEALCAALMQASGELITVLDRETNMLRKAQTHELDALTLRKQTLSAALAKHMDLLRRNAEFIKDAVPGQITRFKEQNRQFHRSLNANHVALRAMAAVSENLLRTIAHKVGATQSGPETYGKNAAPVATTRSKPTAISVDRTL